MDSGMDSYIGAIIILFLLSIICERIADFLKSFLSVSNSGLGGLIGKWLRLGDLVTKSSDEKLEAKRAYRILKINLFCGIVVALGLHADLYSIVILHKDDPLKGFGWENADFLTANEHLGVEGIVYLLGCIATGCFISFGSKFWHDLLDILLQIKNYRRVLADPGTYTIDNVKSLERIANTYQSDFIKAAYLEAEAKFMAITNVKAVSIKKDNLGYYFEVKTKQHDSAIGRSYQYLLTDGTPMNIPVKVIVLGATDIRPHSLDLSSRIFNMKQKDDWGTMGCLVKSTENSSSVRYLLTCCHNVVHPVRSFDKPASVEIGASDGGALHDKIGTLHDAELTAFVDGALIEIDAAKISSIDHNIPQLGKPGKPRTLKSSDVGIVTGYIYGAASQENSDGGLVTSVYTSIEVKYDGQPFQLNNLVTVSSKGKPISKPGDSGSCVLDKDLNVLGLVVAGDDTDTYVLPIETLLLKFKVELV